MRRGTGSALVRRQTIIWTSAGLLSIGPLGTNFSQILIKTQNFSFGEMHLEVPSAKWRPVCPGGRWVNSLTLSVATPSTYSFTGSGAPIIYECIIKLITSIKKGWYNRMNILSNKMSEVYTWDREIHKAMYVCILLWSVLCPLEAVPGTAILMPRHAFMFIRWWRSLGDWAPVNSADARSPYERIAHWWATCWALPATTTGTYPVLPAGNETTNVIFL